MRPIPLFRFWKKRRKAGICRRNTGSGRLPLSMVKPVCMKPYTTYIVIFLNVTVFAALAIHLNSLTIATERDALTVLHWGSNVNPLTLGGQPWRMFTSMFLHFGIWHLLVNMYALYGMGRDLEPAVGNVRFALIYLFCGIAGNVASLAFNLFANSAGASGALFGLYGYSLAASWMSSSDPQMRSRTVVSFVIFAIINALISASLSVDLAAHIGGFAGGLLLAVVQLRFRGLIRNPHLAIASVVLFGCIFLLPRDQVDYYQLFQRVIRQERKLNLLFNGNSGDAEILDSLQQYAGEWTRIGEGFETLSPVREALRHDTSIVRNYARIHKQMGDYRIILLARQSYVYFDSIELANAAFDTLGQLQHHLDYYPAEKSTKADEQPDTTNQSALKTQRIFYDALWKETENPSDAYYYRIGQVDSIGRWQGAVRDFYRNGDIQMKGSYKDNLKDGVFLYYSDHKTYTSAGRYVREEAAGKWESFYWNGALETETYYTNGTFVKTVLDSLGNVQVQDGNGVVTKWHSNGAVAETGQYVEGRRSGDWLGYFRDGEAYFREFYNDNRLVQGAAVDERGKRYVYDELSRYAYPEKGMEAFNTYVTREIRRPEGSAGTRIRLLFQVGRKGDLWDFVVLEGGSPACEQEALRLVREGPPWRQGLEHGHIPVPSQGYAIIQF